MVAATADSRKALRRDTPRDRRRAAAVEARRLEGRRARYALRARLWKLSGLPSVKGCARNVAAPSAGGAGLATIGRSADGRAGWSGVTLCQSIWACPCCSARIRQDRAVDVERAGVAWLNQGRALYFLTLTMPHDAGDALAELLDCLLASWKKLQQRKRYRELRARHGLRFIRAVEITHTRRQDGGSGWHPHLHVLLFADELLSDLERADLLDWLESTWAELVTSFRRADGSRFRVPRRDGIGVNLRDVEGRSGSTMPAALFAYLSKVQDSYGDSWGVGAELARGDLKTGRKALSRTPFDLLELAAGLAVGDDGQLLAPDPAALRLWHEYELATKGRKALHWSDGLRQLLELPEAPAASVPEVPGELVTVLAVDAGTYRRLARRPLVLVELLELAEREWYAELHELVAATLEAVPPPRTPADLRPR
jgi:hypothetical protein